MQETKRPSDYLRSHLPQYLQDLKNLVRIPSVSFEGFPEAPLRECAGAVADIFRKRGLEKVEILEVAGVRGFPYVYAEWCKAPGAPTVLLYAHYDVQPPGRTEVWNSPPFEGTEKEGPGGHRLYGRGSADDKAGLMVHIASVESWLKTHGELPCNVKIVIEGEEEAGSGSLPAFLKQYRDRLDADVMVLADSTNFDCGVPALTVALRGLVAVDVEVRALTKSVHSGMWGGPLPDPVLALSKILASTVDDDGRIAIPGVLDGFTPVSEKEAAEHRKIPYREEDFRKQSGLIDSARILKQGESPAVQVWRYPSLTVTAIQASSRAAPANIINDAAWARVTIRVAAGMDPENVMKKLKEHLRSKVPWGLSIQFGAETCGAAWWGGADASPATEAAVAALKEGYHHDVILTGCGGSIPFVQPFSDALGGAPALLTGVEDPYTNAHGENESLLISDFEKACVSQILFFAELARRWKK